MNKHKNRQSRGEAILETAIKTVRRMMTGNFKRSCPFVRYSQTAGEVRFSDEIIRQVFSEAEKLLTGYFQRCWGKTEAEASPAARKALAAYESAVQMVLLSGDQAYFGIMEEMLNSVL
jgi:hypothetical protein